MLDDVGAFLVFGPIAGLAVALIVVVVWIARDLRRAADSLTDRGDGEKRQGE
ncbi:MAG TPA: hypothetical protein VIA06_15245 [Candidatus Dormibacteraeota bacterium]|jgi:hypothetical protein|nr:hypothetical protein [Candidatus Dormibacteraeota bacterium]